MTKNTKLFKKYFILNIERYFPSQTDVNYTLEHILPILLRRSADGVHNLDKPPSKTHQKKVNDFMESTVGTGEIAVVRKGPLYLTKLYAPLKPDPKLGTPKTKNPKQKTQMTPKQIYARLEIIEKVLATQQRHISEHWTIEQMFDETFRLGSRQSLTVKI